MSKKLIVDETICCGCLSCMINCAQNHQKTASLFESRIHIELEPFQGSHIITYCQQCENSECVENCPQEAIKPVEGKGYYQIDYDLCIDCRTCVEVCPNGAVFVSLKDDRIIKCDLCDGNPVCVQSCFTGALWFGNEEEERPDKLVSRYFHNEKVEKQ